MATLPERTGTSIFARLAAIACAIGCTCPSDGAELPRHDSPDERISYKEEYRPNLFRFNRQGFCEVDNNLWLITSAAGPLFTDSGTGPREALIQWRWSGDRLAQAPYVPIEKDTFLKCVLAADRYIFRESGAPDEIVMRDRKGTVLNRWPTASVISRVFPSANGKYGAVFSVPQPFSSEQPFRVGLIDTEAGTLTWVMEFQQESQWNMFLIQKNAEITAEALPTDDGKLIAVMPFIHPMDDDPSIMKEYDVAIMDVVSRKLLWTTAAEEVRGARYAMRFSVDSSVLFVGKHGPSVVSLDTKTGKVLDSWAATPDGEQKTGIGLPYVSFIAVSPDGQYMAAVLEGISGGEVYVRSLRNQTAVRLVHGSEFVANAAIFSPDSQHLATMDTESICIWSKDSWK